MALLPPAPKLPEKGIIVLYSVNLDFTKNGANIPFLFTSTIGGICPSFLQSTSLPSFF